MFFHILISSNVPGFLQMHDADSDAASANGPSSFVLVLLQYGSCCFVQSSKLGGREMQVRES